MQFLKTLFWVVLAVILVLFASVNWHPATLRLWGGIEVDVKLPVLMFGAFLLGFIPTLAFFRARIWSLQRRLDAVERQAAGLAWAATPAQSTDPDEQPTSSESGERPATS